MKLVIVEPEKPDLVHHWTKDGTSTLCGLDLIYNPRPYPPVFGKDAKAGRMCQKCAKKRKADEAG